jgi:hypothetical protein
LIKYALPLNRIQACYALPSSLYRQGNHCQFKVYVEVNDTFSGLGISATDSRLMTSDPAAKQNTRTTDPH